jgi:orotidine-5'-phosphate decarboxylase
MSAFARTLGPADRLIFALDAATPSEALELAQAFRGHLRWLKVGPRLFTHTGPALIAELRALGYHIFLDLKLHDIPDVVAEAAVEAARLGVEMLTLHTLGGRRMLESTAAKVRKAAQSSGLPRPMLFGVTLLTSMEPEEARAVGLQGSAEEIVSRLATLALETGLDGIVCSPLELAAVRARFSDGLRLLAPGIRPADELLPYDDQRRIATPEAALRAGADFLVVGRPIRLSPQPLLTIQRLLEDIERTLTPP